MFSIFLKNHLVSWLQLYRMGITDQEVEGVWKSIRDGSNVTFTKWLAGEPNGGRTENCGTFFSGKRRLGLYNDGPCSTKYSAYVCVKRRAIAGS